MLLRRMFLRVVALAVVLNCLAAAARAQVPTACMALSNYMVLKAALEKAVADDKSGLNNHMWATIVGRDGTVCAVAFSGKEVGAQWLGSRLISAQRANTANLFSLDSSSGSNGSGQAKGLAMSTANLYAAVQPGGSFFGLQASNPVNTPVAYKGPSSAYGTARDPMVGEKIGGINVSGGGVGLYAAGGKLVGGLGLSGDTPCADHMVAWLTRKNLNLDHLAGVGGVSGDNQRPDNIVYDIGPNNVSKGGFGHPRCINTTEPNTLPPVSQ